MKQFSILLFILSLSTLGFTAKAQVLASDSLALVALYNSTNGSGWTNKTNWLTGNVNTWRGITTTSGRVTAILLNNNNLIGSLPVELGALSEIVSIEFYDNFLSGNVPTFLGDLTQLQYLDLDNNAFTGSIPPELGNAVALDYLNLGENQLIGLIPVELLKPTSLTFLALNNNSLTGSIPPQVLNLSGLMVFWIHKNLISSIPDMSSLSSLISIQVQNNILSFKDIEPNIAITAPFVYNPQGLIPGGGAQSLTAGQAFNISFIVGGSANQYQWRKNGVTIAGATSNSFSIPSVALSDAGTFELFSTSSLVPGLTIQTEPIVLSVTTGVAIIEVIENGTPKPSGDDVVFSTTGIGNEQNKQLEIANTGNTQLVITDIQVTGDFSLQSAIPPPIDPGNNTLLSLRFAPTDLGARVGTLTILSNGDVPVFTINLTGEGEIEPIVYNVVTTNKNGKHDFLNIANITYFPENKVIIYDRWGNKVFERNGYDNTQNVFAGTSDDNVVLPDGTYYYVIDKNNGDKPLHGFIYLRR